MRGTRNSAMYFERMHPTNADSDAANASVANTANTDGWDDNWINKKGETVLGCPSARDPRSYYQ